MVTSKGTMVFALDAVSAPRTVNNFVFLARYHYFDGIAFHRIIPVSCCRAAIRRGPAPAGPATVSRTSCPNPGATSSARSPWPMPGGHETGASSSSSRDLTGCVCRRSTRCSVSSSPGGTSSRQSTRWNQVGGPKGEGPDRVGHGHRAGLSGLRTSAGSSIQAERRGRLLLRRRRR